MQKSCVNDLSMWPHCIKYPYKVKTKLLLLIICTCSFSYLFLFVRNIMQFENGSQCTISSIFSFTCLPSIPAINQCNHFVFSAGMEYLTHYDIRFRSEVCWPEFPHIVHIDNVDRVRLDVFFASNFVIFSHNSRINHAGGNQHYAKVNIRISCRNWVWKHRFPGNHVFSTIV